MPIFYSMIDKHIIDIVTDPGPCTVFAVRRDMNISKAQFHDTIIVFSDQTGNVAEPSAIFANVQQVHDEPVYPDVPINQTDVVFHAWTLQLIENTVNYIL